MKTIKEICIEMNISEWQAKALRAKEHGITPEIITHLLDHYIALCAKLQENSQTPDCQNTDSLVELT